MIEQINEGVPIKNVSIFPMANAGFLGAERNLLKSSKILFDKINISDTLSFQKIYQYRVDMHKKTGVYMSGSTL